MDSSQRKETLVEEGTEFQGAMKSKCSVVVNGTFDGQIDAPELRVAGTGSVQGEIRASKLRSEGILAGSIDANEVYLSGAVCSNTRIRTHKLEMKLRQEGGKLELTFGECETDPVSTTSATDAADGGQTNGESPSAEE